MEFTYMTVARLREILAGFDGDVPVTVECESAGSTAAHRVLDDFPYALTGSEAGSVLVLVIDDDYINRR